MDHSKNIWSASFEIFSRNAYWVLVYCAMVVAVSAIDHAIDINSGTDTVLRVVMSSFLAIPAHLAALAAMNSNEINAYCKQNPKLFGSFMLRCLLIGLLGSIVPFAAAVGMLIAGADGKAVILVSVVLWILAGVGAFAKWGTMLPAITLGDDPRMAAASVRSRHSFGYAFSRLLVSFVLVSFIMLLVLGLFVYTTGLPLETQAGNVVLAVVAGPIGAYQIIMTSVVLSRSYLLAKPRMPVRGDTGLTYSC